MLIVHVYISKDRSCLLLESAYKINNAYFATYQAQSKVCRLIMQIEALTHLPVSNSEFRIVELNFEVYNVE